jgi:hypothetical protein
MTDQDRDGNRSPAPSEEKAMPRLLLATLDDGPGHAAARLCRAQGWDVVHVVDAPAAIAAARLWRFAAIRLVADPGRGDALPVTAIERALHPDDRDRMIVLAPGAGLAPETPPVDDLPSEPRADPRTQLAPLLGAAASRDLIRRFHARLTLLLSAPNPYAADEGDTPAALAHRIGGLAGMLGFGDLAAAWLAVETEGSSRLEQAWLETRIAHALLTFLMPDDPGI